MRRKINLGGFLMVVLAAAVFSFMAQAEDLASLCGVYDVQGWEPEGDTSSTPDYTGTTIISGRGKVYAYRGMADGNQYEGIGYAEGDRIYFGWRGSDGDAGILKGDNRNGVWVCQWVAMSQAEGKPGKEIWLRRKPMDAPPDPAPVESPEVAE